MSKDRLATVFLGQEGLLPVSACKKVNRSQLGAWVHSGSLGRPGA